MREFKEGDQVRRIKSNYGNLKIGDILTISSINNSKSLYFVGDSQGYDRSNFELVKKVKTVLNNPFEWNFIIHDKRQISELEISENLTVDNPVALVTIKNGKKESAIAVYHKSIMVKAILFEVTFPKLKTIKDFPKAIKFVRKIRQLQWNKPEQVVTVRIPKL